MRRATLQLRSLAYHWRTNVAVVLGATVATAALTGALIVGDSMRGSLAEIALGRLGRVDYALVAPRFFPADLAERVSQADEYTKQFAPAVPIILMQGAARHAETRALAGGVNILGVDQRFWQLDQSEPRPLGSGLGEPNRLGSHTASESRAQELRNQSPNDGVIINDALAMELSAKVGDDIVLRLRRPSAISTESLLGRRDESAASMRLSVSRILPAKGLGGFSVEARQAAPKNVFVPLETLQRALRVEDAANALLIASTKREASRTAATGQAASLQLGIDHHLTLADLGLRLHARADQGYVSLESEALLLSPALETAAFAVAESIQATVSPILTHLANSISISRPADSTAGETQSPSIPYSTIAAIEPRSLTAAQLARVTREGAMLTGAGDLLLNRWAANDLQAQIGDRIEVAYYVSGPLGRIDTRTRTFTLRGIVEMEGPAIDRGFIPEYPGVTDTQNLADWDPPFPVDLKKVRDKDEQYWDDYRTAPKAFITLEEGQELWAAEGGRLGRLTSIRLSPGQQRPQATPIAEAQEKDAPSGNSPQTDELKAEDLKALAARFETALLEKIKPAELGFALQAARANAMEASRGDTDFGGLFIGFSFFLIAAAAMLVGLLFRLGVERRATEIGTLLAMGFAPRAITINLVLEGLTLSAIGAVLGLVAASGYAWLMLAGLRTWWSAAVNAPFLQLHARPASYAVGFFASVLIAGGSAGWAVRGLTRRSPRSLLSGSVAAEKSRSPRFLGLDTWIAIGSAALAVALVLIAAMTDRLPVLAFFFAGALVLIGAMAAFGRWLRRPSTRVLHVPGSLAVARLAMRNAPRYRGRGMLTAGLIASATFVIVALEAFRLDTHADVHAKDSGTGGFALFAESAVPLPYDLNTPEGREALGLEAPQPPRERARVEGESAARVEFQTYSFRLRPGDETSCLNLYVSVQPRIAGAPEAFIERGGFAFAGTSDKNAESSANPWRLLHEELGAGVVPAIGDEASVLWQLHSGLGKDFTITDEQGREVQLRFVALLKGSALQDEVIVSEKNFERLFPSIEGRSFFLIDVPPQQADDVENTLEQELDRFGFDVGSMANRLTAYNSVQNTYLSTFQTLGGLGLVLGTFGLAAILLRNVWERRRELALMRATGFSRLSIGATVLLENALLVVVGLASGTLAATVAVAPRLISMPESVPVRSLGCLIGLVLLSGFSAGLVGLFSTLRLNLVASLRSE